MSLDQLIARAVAAAIQAGKIPAGEDGVGACHVLVQHRIGCPVRRSHGRDDRCTCGEAVQITLHSGEHADCETCAGRPNEH
jgi:hypothetical protein